MDYFRVSVPQTGTLTVETTGSTNTRGWLGTSAAWLASDEDSGSGNNFRIIRQVTRGTYYVLVGGDNDTATGAYTLRLRFTAGGIDDHGNTRTSATVIRLPSDTGGRLERRGDVDYFRVSVPQTGTLTVETTGSTNTRGWLGTSAAWLASDEDSGSGNNFRIIRQVTRGTYYVLVGGDNDTATGAYTLRLRFTAGGSCGRDPRGDVDRAPPSSVSPLRHPRAVWSAGAMWTTSASMSPGPAPYTVDTTGSTATVRPSGSGTGR